MRLPRLSWPALALSLALVAGCGAEPGDPDASVDECRARWGDVAQTIYAMDSETHPSAMSERWSTIIASAEYQRDFGDGKSCSEQITKTVASIDTLRRFIDRLRRFDMEYQLHIIAPQAELYLTDDLPKPRKGVKPPTKPEVRRAYEQLRRRAADANRQLTPAWQQAVSIDLGSVDQVRKAIKDLDRLAVSSPAFRQSHEALEVIVRAIKAQEAG